MRSLPTYSASSFGRPPRKPPRLRPRTRHPRTRPVFRPEERDISSKRSEQRLVAEKTKEVWQQAKPFVTDTFYLNRAENTVVHENAFWGTARVHGDAREHVRSEWSALLLHRLPSATAPRARRTTATRLANSPLRRRARCSTRPTECSSPALATTPNSSATSWPPLTSMKGKPVDGQNRA